jgi:cold shock CspA family protein
MDGAPLQNSEMTAPTSLPEPAAASAGLDNAPPGLKLPREPRSGPRRGGGPGTGPAGRAHAIDVPSDAPRFHGVVVSRQEKFGFVKAQETEARYFFHLRDTDGVATHGAQVTFVVARDRTAGKDVAYDVVTIAERPRGGPTAASGSLPAHPAKGREERLPGTFTGVVAAVPRGPAAVRIDDGMIVFTDGAGMQQQALFGGWRLAPGGPPPGLGETVEFGLVRNTATGVFKATGVRLANTAALAAALASAHAALAGLAGPPGAAMPPTALPPPSGRQLGRVALLKKEFGFIRQVTRPGDLFFHFSQLDGITPGEIRTGDDVEFSVVRDRDGKLSAAAVRRAAPGAVVFDTVSAETLEGVVLEKPLVTKQYVQSSGVLE